MFYNKLIHKNLCNLSNQKVSLKKKSHQQYAISLSTFYPIEYTSIKNTFGGPKNLKSLSGRTTCTPLKYSPNQRPQAVFGFLKGKIVI